MRVLVVDDNEINRKLLRLMLKGEGHEVSEAADGVEAVEKLEPGRFDAVISDILMPRMDGYRFCLEVRKTPELSDLPIIIYTSTYTSDSDEKLALSVGADRFLRKPASSEKIAGVLRDIVKERGKELRQAPTAVEIEVLKEYSEGLVRKLEERNLELEESQRGLAASVGQLEKSETRLSELVDFAPIGIFEVTPEGTIVAANAAIVNRLGYDSVEELLHLDSARDIFFEPLELPTIFEKFEGAPQPIEIRLKRKGGSPVWFEVNGRAVRGSPGNTARYEVFAIDINARKTAEKESFDSSHVALQGRRAKTFRDVVVGALLAVLVALVVRPLLKMDEKWVDEVVVVLIFLAAAGFVFSYRRLKEVRTEVLERERVEQALRFLRGDLEGRVEVRTAELRKANEGLRAEIEERRRTEDALRKSEEALRSSAERYRLLFEKNPEPMWVFDEETFAFLAVNGAACRHYGYSREEFLSMTIREIRPADQIEPLLAHLSGETEDHEKAGVFKHQKKDGTVIEVEITSDRLVFDGRKGQLVLAIDVTERRLLETQLRLAQKMEAVGLLAGGVAHDFNNLLTVILGYGSLLASRFAPDATDREEIDEILRASERAAALTRQLLAFSRRQVLEPIVLSVNDLILDLEKMLRRLIEENVELVTHLSPSVANVRADPGQLEQVIMNLVVNARDAMPTGGKLTIETSNAVLDQSYVQRHVSVQPGRYVMVAVSDTGTGMDAETQAHIFEPFFTTKELGKGTGLGLSTVYGIVKQSGGNIWVYSEPGKGTTFKVYLPQVDAAIESGEQAAPYSPRASEAETILLVEDDPSIRALAKRVLEEHGYRVLDAGSGHEALERNEHENGPIHLLLTDLVMPGMGGAELASRLQEERPAIRVLFMSGYTDDGVVRNGLLGSGRAFLQKPFTPAVLMRKLRDVLS